MRILVVEDERRIAQAIKEGLEQESYAVDVEYNGEDGLNAGLAEEYDLIMLDVMMPIMNGYEVCKELRAKGIKSPILILTAKDQDKDIIEGLDSGADDYLPKPFSFSVLLARIRALLRRPATTLPQQLKVGTLKMDPVRKEVQRSGKTVKLSAKEFAILEYFMRNPNRVLSKNNIMSHVWDFDSGILPNNIEVFMTYLRAKIDKPFNEKPLIHTVRGFGYKISEE